MSYSVSGCQKRWSAAGYAVGSGGERASERVAAAVFARREQPVCNRHSFLRQRGWLAEQFGQVGTQQSQQAKQRLPTLRLAIVLIRYDVGVDLGQHGGRRVCDRSSSNTSAYPEGVKILLANCMAHGRRHFVEVRANFPDQCRHVLEQTTDAVRNP